MKEGEANYELEEISLCSCNNADDYKQYDNIIE